ncbi:MAG: class I SAM-dependent methyltransferase [Phycisphaerae bacterium]|nr:class I SAM-dependent methyltransferase [Phycisphaerae bacterium]
MSKRKQIRSHYEWRISRLRENHDILDWADAESQAARFSVLVENVDPDGKSLLDVGAGLGDLASFLEQRKISVGYTGVDLLEKMVAEARRRHPDAKFLCADVFTNDCFKPGSFDVVFCSGIFNLNLGNNLLFLPGAIRRLLGLSRDWVVFNLLHKRAAHREEKYFHYDPAEVLAILEPLPCQMRIIDDYLPNDFTLICRKAGANK